VRTGSGALAATAMLNREFAEDIGTTGSIFFRPLSGWG
jgi:hypothetical protein